MTDYQLKVVPTAFTLDMLERCDDLYHAIIAVRRNVRFGGPSLLSRLITVAFNLARLNASFVRVVNEQYAMKLPSPADIAAVQLILQEKQASLMPDA